MAALFGADDRVAKRTSKRVEWASPWQALRWSLRTVAPGATIRQRVARLQGIRDEGEVTRKLMEARLERAPCFAPIADLAANHNQRIDGTGYQRGLGGDALDLPVRVPAVADVYEALTADRPYRGPMPVEKALDIVFRDVPGRLDRSACAALETWLGRSAEPGSREDVGVLALGEDLSGPAPEPETRPVVPPRGVPRV
jgi:hypothetical protein